MLAVLAVSGTTGCRRTKVAKSPPNVVLIVVDTLRADKMSSYGFPLSTSPELDQLASDGVRFANVIAQSSWTRPSIGSMLTSRYPRSIGIYDEKYHQLDGRFVTLAESLKAGGYTTVGATANPNINSSFGFSQGFDHYIDSDILWSWMDPEPGKRSFEENPLLTAGEVFDRTLRRIDEHVAPPYYVQLNVMEVHEANRWFRKTEAAQGPFRNHPDRPYLLALHNVSRQIGHFVRTLSARPGWRNTLFVITSDHGEGLQDHPDVATSKGHGHLLYESQLIVPLILYNPAGGLRAGAVIDERVRLLDLMPTLLDYTKVSPPEQMDGRSLMPLVRKDGPVILPEHFMVETEIGRSEKIGVYTPAWKFIENRKGHEGVNPIELQAVGTVENGAKTDVGSQHANVMQQLAAFISSWERAHPKSAPVKHEEALSPTELEQLRALGYIE